ncbi:MAG TPA: sigma-70 family RNA polymerase sigma factor [Pyrinomonadaceae bacterium]|nr:sigma-70 family RNA polymerase sigma factor [Pyrinomonadaceae bacterium]
MAEVKTNERSDYALAQAAGRGDMQAFEELYLRHNRRVYSLCLRMTRNVTDAEDLAQEVFVQLFRKIGSFRGQAAFTTWLHRLTVNQVLMHFRKRGVRLEQTTEDGETPVQVVKGTENHRTMPIVDYIALDDAIAQLPPGYRLVFTLHDIEGHQHEEIARMLGRTVGTSKSQLHKARMKLRSLLKRRNKPVSPGPDGGNGSLKQMTQKKTTMRTITEVTPVGLLGQPPPHWRNVSWHFSLLLATLLFLSLSAQGQTVEPNNPQSTTADQTQTVNIEHYLDRLIASAVVAVDAASVIKEADRFRTEGNQRLKNGRRDDGRALLRQAGEIIAAAAPDGDIKQQDPLLREYLREITKELVALDGAPAYPAVPLKENVVAGNYAAQPRVAAFLNYFQRGGRNRLEIGRARLTSLRPMMVQVLREEGVPEWLISVGFVESTYNSRAHSPKEAHGIWQFIPGTGDRYGLKRTAWTDERGNPEKSTRAAARYLRDLHALFGDWPLALAAYNWGEGRLARLVHRTGIRDFWTLAERGLVPPETANYVPSVLAASQLLIGNGAPVVEAQAESRKRHMTVTPVNNSGGQLVERK